MRTDAGSDGWYFDERTVGFNGSRSPGYVWTYGVEVWCNKPGRFVNIVADLRHLTPPYEMSLCSVGIMGASYVRDEPLPEVIEVFHGQHTSITVPHIFDELSNGRVPLIAHLRQASPSLLAFVSFTEDQNASVVHIDASGASLGDHELVIESFDSRSSTQATLRTD